jgi:hypothetical protein
MCFAQSPDKNYILKTTLLDTVTDPDLISELEDWQKSDVIEYYDGLGRLAQTNNFHSSPAGHDFIQHVEYDTLVGRNLTICFSLLMRKAIFFQMVKP